MLLEFNVKKINIKSLNFNDLLIFFIFFNFKKILNKEKF